MSTAGTEDQQHQTLSTSPTPNNPTNNNYPEWFLSLSTTEGEDDSEGDLLALTGQTALNKRKNSTTLLRCPQRMNYRDEYNNTRTAAAENDEDDGGQPQQPRHPPNYGKVKNFFRGSCFVGPDFKLAVGTFAMIGIPSVIFDACTAPWIAKNWRAGWLFVTVIGILQLTIFILFVGTAFCDPGILPRQVVSAQSTSKSEQLLALWLKRVSCAPPSG